MAPGKAFGICTTRGQLNGGYTAITGTPSAEEDWSLDPLGNCSGYVQKTSGTTDLDQSRAVNKANEITGITETTGPSWAAPAYDRAGNMTSVPKPVDLTASYDCTYDAWNRLVKVEDGAYTIGVYEYDPLMRRVKRHFDSAAPDSPAGIDSYEHCFYNDAWQLLETRETDTESDQPESLQPKYQWVWSPRYIDAAILQDLNTDNDGTCDDERLYLVSDASFSLTSLLDTTGESIERRTYLAYGKPTVWSPSWTTAFGMAVTKTDAAFTGRTHLFETGFLDFRMRIYAPQLGLFCSRDQLGYVDAYSTYAAVFVPCHFDPYGLTVIYNAIDRNGKPKEQQDQAPHPELWMCNVMVKYPPTATNAYQVLTTRGSGCEKVAPRSITIYWSFSTNADGPNWHREWALALEGFGRVLGAYNIREFIDVIGREIGSCECISDLNILTHGGFSTEGGFRFGDTRDIYDSDWISANNVYSFAKSIKGVMCSECEINMMACSSADGPTMAALAKETGCKVRGCSSYFNRQSGEPASWEAVGGVFECTPSGKCEMILDPHTKGTKPW